MANTFNTGVHKEEYETMLQKRLNKPTTWAEVCDVKYSSNYIINWPYMSTEFSAQSGTRGTAFGWSDFALTNDTVTISAEAIVPVFVDWADWAQIQYNNKVEIGTRQGAKISEQLESVFFATHGSWTDFGDTGGGALGLAATQITVSNSNIDDIVSGVLREIRTANGQELMDQNGVAFVWTSAQFEKLEQYLRSAGFNLADSLLREGIPGSVKGYKALGAYHYVSTSHTANHVFAGVRKIVRLGILRDTYGRLYVNENPADGDGTKSGIGMHNRVDYGTQIPGGYTTLVYDVNVV